MENNNLPIAITLERLKKLVHHYYFVNSQLLLRIAILQADLTAIIQLCIMQLNQSVKYSDVVLALEVR